MCNGNCASKTTDTFPVMGAVTLDVGYKISSRPAISVLTWAEKSVHERALLIREMFTQAGDAIATQYITREAVSNGDS